MLRRSGELQWSQVHVLDGGIGKVRDIYFDAESWLVRNLIVDTGGWLSGRNVPIEPRSVELIDRNLHTVWVSLLRAQVESIPGIQLGEIDATQPQLRSVRRMLDFTLMTVDGHVGLIKDFFFDDATWALRYLIVQTGRRLLGRRVLVNTDRVRRVDWISESVVVNQTRRQVEYGWEFDADNPPPGDLEMALRNQARTEAWRQ